MSAAAFGYRTYRWRGADEWLAEIGSGPAVLLVPPLFEELNRCRALLAWVMRGLADRGLRAVLPDLPGTGESPRELEDVAWEDWSGAIAAVAADLATGGKPPLLASVRGGALIDGEAEAIGRWRFAPATGASLTRDLIRARQAILPEKARAEQIDAEARTSITEFAGYLIPPALYSSLRDATFSDRPLTRIVRLESDPADADLKLAGKPLWRQSEPGNDRALAARLASDIADWHQQCAT